jgi:hypothetical protein
LQESNHVKATKKLGLTITTMDSQQLFLKQTIILRRLNRNIFQRPNALQRRKKTEGHQNTYRKAGYYSIREFEAL